jgi:hypothetical protein
VTTDESVHLSFIGADGHRLRQHPGIGAVTSLDVRVDPLGTPFDCRALVGLPRLRTLTLTGALAHLDALGELALTSLTLRLCPDLSGLPPLSSWPGLTSVVAWNVEESASRRLLEEGRVIGAGQVSGHVSVSRPRRRRFFDEELGRPLATLPAGQAKEAARLFGGASAWIARARSEETVRTAVETFVHGVGELPGVDATDRVEVSDAIRRLVSTSPVPVDERTALAWSDAVRAF